jgi:hypothetical protein
MRNQVPTPEYVAPQTEQGDPFSQVRQVLDGKATIRPIREAGAIDICDAVLPPNQLADSSKPSLLVSLSPNSSDSGANGASNPLIASIGLTYITILQANPKRQRIFIQNNGGTGLYLVLGSAATFGASSSALYHIKIPTGTTYIDEMWVGRVDIVSDAPGGLVSAFELFRQLNVSQ